MNEKVKVNWMQNEVDCEIKNKNAKIIEKSSNTIATDALERHWLISDNIAAHLFEACQLVNEEEMKQ